MALHLNKHESPSPKDALCQVWLKLAQWFLRIRWKYNKFTDRWTDGRTTDTRQSAEKLTWAFSLGELKTKPCVVLPGPGDSGLWFSRGPTSKHGTTSYSGCGSFIGEETQCWLRPSWKMSTWVLKCLLTLQCTNYCIQGSIPPIPILTPLPQSPVG